MIQGGFRAALQLEEDLRDSISAESVGVYEWICGSWKYSLSQSSDGIEVLHEGDENEGIVYHRTRFLRNS